MELVIDKVTKQYDDGFVGLNNFSLKLKDGVVGLLGPNGAGKSTLMKMLSTITLPTNGTITWNGIDIVQDPDALRIELGYLPQYFGVYPNLTADEFLQYLATIKGIEKQAAKKRIEELLELTNLKHARKRRLGGYSGGMKQRVGIAQALLNDPKLLIVDEPTVGLDPQERVRFRNLIADLSEDRIVILSTHIVGDIEATATNIALVNQGNLLSYSAPEEILQTVDGKVWTMTVSSSELSELKKKYLVSNTIRRSTGIQTRIVHDDKPSESADPVTSTLEDAYLYQIQKSKGG